MLSWHFYATSHGKGVVDAIGRTVKRLVWQHLLVSKAKCSNATDFVKIAKSKTKVITVEEITQQDIDKSTAQLRSFFSNTVSVKNIQKLHSVVVLQKDIIECRLYDYSSDKWTVFF